MVESEAEYERSLEDLMEPWYSSMAPMTLSRRTLKLKSVCLVSPCTPERIWPMMKRIMNKPTAPAPILKILDLITVESFDDFSGRLLAAI